MCAPYVGKKNTTLGTKEFSLLLTSRIIHKKFNGGSFVLKIASEFSQSAA